MVCASRDRCWGGIRSLKIMGRKVRQVRKAVNNRPARPDGPFVVSDHAGVQHSTQGRDNDLEVSGLLVCGDVVDGHCVGTDGVAAAERVEGRGETVIDVGGYYPAEG